MPHARCFAGLVVLALVVGAGVGLAGADLADAADEESGETQIVTRAFRIDEFFRVLNWSAEKAGLPDVMEGSERTPFELGGTFGDLFGAAVADPDGTPSPVELRELVQRSVNNQTDPQVAAWADEGGPAAIEFMKHGRASLVIVSQTPHGLKRVEDFFQELRGNLQTGGPMLTIHARWIAVEDGRVDALIGAGPKRSVPAVLDAKAIDVSAGRTLYRGATTTFNRMQVFIAAGTLQTYVANADPVVCGSWVGTKPVVKPLLVGAFLEVRPLLSDDRKTVLLDYVSYVNHAGGTEPGPLVPPLKPMTAKGDASVRIDKAQVACHTLRGSVRIPLDKTVLLGLTTGPDLKEDTVYALVVEVSASEQ